MKCNWSPKCKNEATVLVPHPMLGDVPACDRCAKNALEGDDLTGLKKMDQLLVGDGVLTIDGISTGRKVWRDIFKDVQSTKEIGRDIFEYAQNMKAKRRKP